MGIKIKPVVTGATAPAVVTMFAPDLSKKPGKPKAYRITSLARCSEDSAVLNEVVFDLLVSDYGTASDDSGIHGIPFKAVTFKPDGDYPFFTIAEEDLKPHDA